MNMMLDSYENNFIKKSFFTNKLLSKSDLTTHIHQPSIELAHK